MEQEYLNSRKYLIKMLIDRGYTVPDKETPKGTKIEPFTLQVKRNDEICMIFYEIHLKYGKEQLYKTLDIVKKNAKDSEQKRTDRKEEQKINVIIVMLYKSGSTLDKYKNEYNFGRTGINVELWLASNLQFDVTDNNFVPKHEIFTGHLGIPSSKLPRILSSDPQVRYLGAKSGDIIKITRTSETAGHTIIYKRVV